MQSVKAYAKINLALNVNGKSEKLHLLDGIYVSCSLCDKILLSARNDDVISLRYAGKEGIYDGDTAYAMAKRLQEVYHTPGVDIYIEKNIPEKRGLGGSSADAAGVARAFSAEFGLGTINSAILAEVGSDVSFQYRGGCARVSGAGESIFPLTLPKLFFAILVPPIGVSTKECFSLYDRIGGEGGDVDEIVRELQGRQDVKYFNALERAATILAEEIEKGRRILEGAGFACGMTGSGSALFGSEYDERIFREKLKKVAPTDGFTLLTAVTEDIL